MPDNSSGSGEVKFNTNKSAKDTERDMTFDGDARKTEKAGKYPNYWCHKDRGGNQISMDCSEGAETVNIQHRSGSAIQMRPDGAVHITAHNSMYTVVFAENRMTVSGAQDITVKGDASMRVYGDMNTTVHKNYNLTVMGDMNVTAKNLNRSIRGNIDTEAKNVNKRVQGTGTDNYQGAYALVGTKNVTVSSRTGNAYLVAGKDVNVSSSGEKGNINMHVKKQGDMKFQVDDGKLDAKISTGGGGGGGGGGQTVSMVANEGSFDTQADNNISHEAKEGKYQVKAMQQVGIKSTSSNIQVKATAGSIQHEAQQNFSATAQGSAEIRAPSGTATFAGGTTNVNAISGALNMAAQAAGVNLESIGGLLNLNGGIITQLASALTQLEFNFGDIVSAEGIENMVGEKANQPKQEPDLTAEISRWV